jgi:hypothetical protein
MNTRFVIRAVLLFLAANVIGGCIILWPGHGRHHLHGAATAVRDR